ncbi:hypothetical protein GIR22_07015 [Pseudomonas sp. CCM 7891]|uniref:Nucleotide-diphospho-sugar transferase domain-containing protein n=1 Tax=Pseudomonas karstica TaxID=1055468 RepID=A0A7X2UXD5_9PSED|nr:hypothetical protein [Pseudomonas karstica]MTD18899.1 hypothetical protein [Pseudomonas karstica]
MGSDLFHYGRELNSALWIMLSNQLLYLLYGDKTVYRHEAKFSILSALRHRKDPASFTITVMTDQPDEFRGWPVTVLALDAETLDAWQGNGGYHHRRKACAIQAGVQLANKTIFIDTDTVFLKDPSELFGRVTDAQFLMDELEWDWAEGSQRSEYRAFAEEMVLRNQAPAPSLKLFNSGICGMTKANAGILEGAIGLIDQWAHHGATLITIEQIAMSFMLDGRKVVEAKDCINHYFSVKRFHHAMFNVFFDENGEAYRDGLPQMTHSVPNYLPRNSIFNRLRLKWTFKDQSEASRKVAKFYLLGKQAKQCVYLKACRLLWWEKAIEELKVLKPAGKTLVKLRSLWHADAEFLSFAKEQGAEVG